MKSFPGQKLINTFQTILLLNFLNFLMNQQKFIRLKTKVSICRDSKDNYLLSLCIDSNANYLITGDKDLLSIGQMDKTKIISYTDFETIVTSSE